MTQYNMSVTVGANTADLEQSMRQIEMSMDRIRTASRSLGQRMREVFNRQVVATEELRLKQIELQHQWLDLTESSKTYAGTSADFIAAVENMGKAQKKVTDQILANNELAKMSFIRTVGTILARSGQSEKIAANFERMGNPLYTVNNGLLQVSSNLERIARQGQPAALALKMLGPTANMKELQDMTTLITRGLMRFQMVALASGAATALLFAGLHDAAMKNEEYADSFNRMTKTLREAFQPMVDVFAEVMSKVYDFITYIGELIIKFNEAHPFLAKLIQGFLLLIPVLTFILSPLAIGIGLFNGMIAAFSSIWMLIGPLVTGLAAMSGTVMLVAAGIVALVAIGVLLYKNWDTIKAKAAEVWNAIKEWVSNAWETIKSKTSEVWSAVTNWIASAWQSIKDAISTAIETVKTVISNAWQTVTNVTQTIWDGIKSYFSNAWQTITNIFNTAVEVIKNIANLLVQFFMNYTPLGYVIRVIKENWAEIKELFKIGGETVKALWTLLWTKVRDFLEPIISGIKNAISTAWNAIKSVTQTVMNAVSNTISTVWNAIKSAISTVIEAIKSTVSAAWSNVKNVTMTVFNAVKAFIIPLWQGIKSGIDTVLNAIKTAVSTAWSAVSSVTSTVLNTVKTVVSNIWNGIKTTISNVLNGISSAVSSAFSKVKSAMTAPIEAAKDIIKSALDKIKSFFSGLKLTIPKPKIPRISVTKATTSIAGVEIPYPKISVSWYAKGGIFNGASIIGVGERGAEAVVPLQGHRMRPFAEAIAGEMDGANRTAVINNHFTIQRMEVRNENDTKKVARELYLLQERGARSL